MKDKLMKLSQEKGFLSIDKLVKVNNSYYSMWMSELQKWLREVHNIIVFVAPVIPDCKEFGFDIYSNKLNIENSGGFYKSYEQALEIGLQESLKLI